MAEATLNDVTNAIEASNKNRSTQQRFSAFNEYRRHKSNTEILNSLVNEVKALMLPAEALVKEFKIFASAQIDFIKLMEAKFELDRERQASQARLKALNPSKDLICKVSARCLVCLKSCIVVLEKKYLY